MNLRFWELLLLISFTIIWTIIGLQCINILWKSLNKKEYLKTTKKLVTTKTKIKGTKFYNLSEGLQY
jgi:predicted membrane protein